MATVWRWPEPLEPPPWKLAPPKAELERGPEPELERDPEADTLAFDVLCSAVLFPLPSATTAPLFS
ncbi:MAG: hypothetical protein M3350_03220 [Actinomycetota bacterium]|nr:hypothetical protein [Actinomycetota bacterium]